MCCGNKVVAAQQARAASSVTFQVFDSAGNLTATKTSEIAAKLAAARLPGGTYVKVTA